MKRFLRRSGERGIIGVVRGRSDHFACNHAQIFLQECDRIGNKGARFVTVPSNLLFPLMVAIPTPKDAPNQVTSMDSLIIPENIKHSRPAILTIQDDDGPFYDEHDFPIDTFPLLHDIENLEGEERSTKIALAETIQYILQTRFIEHSTKHLHIKTLQKDIASLKNLLQDLPATYHTSSTRSLLEIRSKQDALTSSLNVLGDTLKDNIDNLKQEVIHSREGWSNDIKEWIGQVEAKQKEREGGWQLRVSMWRAKLEGVKGRALVKSMALVISLIGGYAYGRNVRLRNRSERQPN